MEEHKKAVVYLFVVFNLLSLATGYVMHGLIK